MFHQKIKIQAKCGFEGEILGLVLPFDPQDRLLARPLVYQVGPQVTPGLAKYGLNVENFTGFSPKQP